MSILKTKFKFICVKCNDDNIVDDLRIKKIRCSSCSKSYYIHTVYDTLGVFHNIRYSKRSRKLTPKLIANRYIFEW